MPGLGRAFEDALCVCGSSGLVWPSGPIDADLGKIGDILAPPRQVACHFSLMVHFGPTANAPKPREYPRGCATWPISEMGAQRTYKRIRYPIIDADMTWEREHFEHSVSQGAWGDGEGGRREGPSPSEINLPYAVRLQGAALQLCCSRPPLSTTAGTCRGSGACNPRSLDHLQQRQPGPSGGGNAHPTLTKSSIMPRISACSQTKIPST
ncbi:hypothetical protein F4780DRAFT_533911 [Xylariomycetidae sp. FL0641]|nr:hypothetical protein F4780DRAFT_533911 [Xylariomycetidae sp. FL0641]